MFVVGLDDFLTVVFLAVLSILLIARSIGYSGADDGCGNCASTTVLSAILEVSRGERTVSDDHGRSK